MDTTDCVVELQVKITSTCPLCGKRIETRRLLTEEQLSTGNTTQMATYHVRAMKEQVQREKVRRGWRVEMCGACADAPAKAE